MQDLIEKLKQFYGEATLDKLDSLASLYADDAIFLDPVHRVEGLPALRAYFESMYRNVTSCRFEFERETTGPECATLQWTMHYQHPRLAAGRPLQLKGVSVLTMSEGKIATHEDFYDMGAMVYEHVPLLGNVVRRIKARLAG